MTRHYRLSPSKMKRIVLCPGSVDAVETEEAGVFADAGTKLHGLAAMLLQLGDVSVMGLSPDEVEVVSKYANYVWAWEAELAPCMVYVEKTLESCRVPDFGGTPDVVLVSRDTIHVVDLKTGRVPVSPYDNYQLMAYLNLARERFPEATRFFGSIVQPVVTGKPEAVEYTLEQLLDFSFQLTSALGSNDFRAGTHCQYCPMLATCQTARDYTIKCAAFEPVEGMSVEDCLQILDTLVVIQALEKHAKAEMLRKLMRSEQVPGWRLGVSMSNRKFGDPDEVIAALKRKRSLKRRDYMVESLKTPAQLEKVPGAKEIVDKFSVREDNGIIVVEERSRVPRYDPEAVFGVIIEEPL